MIVDIPQPLVFVGLLILILVSAASLFRQRQITVRVPAHYESIRFLNSLLMHAIRSARLGEDEAFACRLALDEACVNIIEHAYANRPTGEIEVQLQAVPGVCKICLTDFGVPYDPKQVSAPQFGYPLDKSEPGGLGLYIMGRLMDDVQYVVSPYGNSLIMVKRGTSVS